MVSNKRFLGAALAAPLALAGCGGEGTFDLTLLHEDCTGNVDFLPPSAELTIRVSGDGMSDVVQRAPASKGSVELPEVPYGSNRVVTVTVNAGGKLVAMGRSAPFEVSASDTPDVTVVVQGVNRFTGAADTANNCVEMSTARAGHTAVLMADGRVLLVGGFKRLEQSGVGTGPVATAEVFDPSVGSFVPVAAPCDGEVCYDVAFGAGVSLPDGKVLVAGGERASADNTSVTAVDTAMIYDPVANKWSARKMASPRRGHTLHRLGNKVLVVGGMDDEKNVLATTEIFDPATGDFAEGPAIDEAVPGRAFHAGAPVNDSTVMIGGGIDGNGDVAAALLYFTVDRSGKIQRVKGNDKAKLPTPVLLGSAGAVNGNFVLVGGTRGYTKSVQRYDKSLATDKVQWAQPSTSAPAPEEIALSDRRIAPCTVQMDANRLLVAGGLNTNGVGMSLGEVVSWNASKREVERSFVGDAEVNSKMALARAFPTCTNLGDGRILVAGGADGSGNGSPSAEIFVIRPL